MIAWGGRSIASFVTWTTRTVRSLSTKTCVAHVQTSVRNVTGLSCSRIWPSTCLPAVVQGRPSSQLIDREQEKIWVATAIPMIWYHPSCAILVSRMPPTRAVTWVEWAAVVCLNSQLSPSKKSLMTQILKPPLPVPQVEMAAKNKLLIMVMVDWVYWLFYSIFQYIQDIQSYIHTVHTVLHTYSPTYSPTYIQYIQSYVYTAIHTCSTYSHTLQVMTVQVQ